MVRTGSPVRIWIAAPSKTRRFLLEPGGFCVVRTGVFQIRGQFDDMAGTDWGNGRPGTVAPAWILGNPGPAGTPGRFLVQRAAGCRPYTRPPNTHTPCWGRCPVLPVIFPTRSKGFYAGKMGGRPGTVAPTGFAGTLGPLPLALFCKEGGTRSVTGVLTKTGSRKPRSCKHFIHRKTPCCV